MAEFKDHNYNLESNSSMCPHGNFASNCSICKEQGEHFDALSETDRKYLFESATVVAEKIIAGHSPDIVIYPDASARPLHYLFKPLFEYLYKRDGTMPKFYFIAPQRDDNTDAYSETIRLLESRSELSRLDTNVLLALKNILHHNPQETRDEHRYAMEDRANDILNSIKDKEKPRIIAIDDYFCTGDTAKELYSVFGDDLEFYALLCGITAEADDLEVTYGMVDPFVPDEDRGWVGSGGFNYRQEDNRPALGVKKTKSQAIASALTQPDRKDSAEDIKKLRSEMNTIGKGILEIITNPKE
jgi:hypothetical protein